MALVFDLKEVSKLDLIQNSAENYYFSRVDGANLEIGSGREKPVISAVIRLNSQENSGNLKRDLFLSGIKANGVIIALAEENHVEPFLADLVVAGQTRVLVNLGDGQRFSGQLLVRN